MNVFKAYLKLIPAYLSSLIIYIVIFIVLLNMTINARSGLNGGGDYLDFNTLAAVIDKDGSEESRAMVKFIEDNPNISVIEVDEDKIQDSLYNRKIEYALTINEGFGEKIAKGQTENILSAEKIEDTSSAMYMETQISSFLDSATMYIKGGFNASEAFKAAAEKSGDGVEIIRYQRENGWNSENSSAYFFFNFLPYILLMMIMPMLTPTFASFMNSDMRSRTLCSPINPVSYTTQIVLGAFLVCMSVLVILLGAGTVISGGGIFNETFVYSLLQMIIFTLFSLSVSVLVGILCSESKKTASLASSIVSNVLGLGMSFLCGVFVSQSLLGEEILNIGKLFPAYWYVRANNMLYGADGAVFDKSEVMMCIGIEALFAAAIFAVALLVSGIKKGKSSR